MHVEPALHTRVARTTQLGARNLELSGLGRLEPGWNFASRHHVLLEPQDGDKKAVNDIRTRELKAYCLVDGHMQVTIGLEIVRRAESAIRSGVMKLPGELL